MRVSLVVIMHICVFVMHSEPGCRFCLNYQSASRSFVEYASLRICKYVQYSPVWPVISIGSTLQITED